MNRYNGLINQSKPECDENGFNVFHYAARGRKPSVFYGAIGFCLRKLCYTEDRVIDMLLKK